MYRRCKILYLYMYCIDTISCTYIVHKTVQDSKKKVRIMRRKKVQLHCLILPETMVKLKEMVRIADKAYIGTSHSIGSIVDVLVNDIKPPIERQRDKVKELAAQLHMEKQILDDMQEVKTEDSIAEKSKMLKKGDGVV